MMSLAVWCEENLWLNFKTFFSGLVLSIKTCHTCQLTDKPNQTLTYVPVRPIPAISQAFEYLIVDSVAPLPRTKSSASYLPTVMCQITRFLVAYPLHTSQKSFSPTRLQISLPAGFCRCWSSSVSSIISLRLTMLRVRARFHKTLKSLLRAYCRVGQRLRGGFALVVISS